MAVVVHNATRDERENVQMQIFQSSILRERRESTPVESNSTGVMNSGLCARRSSGDIPSTNSGTVLICGCACCGENIWMVAVVGQ